MDSLRRWSEIYHGHWQRDPSAGLATHNSRTDAKLGEFAENTIR